MIIEHLKALGFAAEHMGGGCEALSRYLPHGTQILVTASDGAEMPDAADWMIGVYAPIGDTMTDALWMRRSGERMKYNIGKPLREAVACAEAVDRLRMFDKDAPGIVSTSDLMDAAASLWEAAIDLERRVMAEPAKATQWETAFVSEWEDEGTAAMRWKVCAMAERCHTEWKAESDAGSFDAPFDWEWCPEWLASELQLQFMREARPTASVDLNGRLMIPGDLYAGLTLAELAQRQLTAFYAYPAEGGAN